MPQSIWYFYDHIFKFFILICRWPFHPFAYVMCFSPLHISVCSKDTFFGSDRSPRLNRKWLIYLESMNSAMTVVMMTMPQMIPRRKRSQELLKLCVFSSTTLKHAFINKIQKRALFNPSGQLNLLTSLTSRSQTPARDKSVHLFSSYFWDPVKCLPAMHLTIWRGFSPHT